tara:strand:+ start:1146 stop:2402 length:1257 start_codon:yes stop_codon:yes gene_type:complete
MNGTLKIKKINYKKINNCQISKDKNLEMLLSLGLIPPVNQMSRINQRPEEQLFFPTEIYYSKISKLVQLGIAVDKEILFPKSYPYTSSTTKNLRDNFFDLSKEIFKKFNVNKNDLIIDIGSNDGNLLSNFKNKMRVLGITPEQIGKVAISRGIPTILKYFDYNLSNKIKKTYGKAKIITATNVFAHIENVDSVLKSIKNILSDDGIFISESHYLLSLIKNIQYDTIYHEHLRYYSLSSLQYLFSKHNLEIIFAKKISTHGGSIRVYAAKKNRYKIDKKLKELIRLEKINLSLESLRKFKFKVIESKLRLYKLLSELKTKNNKIFGISAPSRATTLINYLGVSSDIITCILEIEGSKKIGHYLPGTDIPIFNEKKLYKEQPEYALILSWHISEEIIANLKRKGFKGRFIIPLPIPKITK